MKPNEFSPQSFAHSYRSLLAHSGTCRQLASLVQAGDKSACERVFILLWPAVCSFPVQQGHVDTPESDAFIDVMLERLPHVVTRFHGRDGAGFASWFYRVLHNAWLDVRRRGRPRFEYEEDMDLWVDPGRNEVERPDVLACLGPSDQAILRLRYPELLVEDAIERFAAGFASGRRGQAIVRLLRGARCLARQRQNKTIDTLARLHVRGLSRTVRRAGSGTAVRGRAFRQEWAHAESRYRGELVRLSYRTIASITGRSVGSVACMIHRARIRIARAHDACLTGREAARQKA